MENGSLAAVRQNAGGDQAGGEKNRGIDAEKRLRGVRLLQHRGEGGGVAGVAAQAAVAPGKAGDAAHAHGLFQIADGVKTAQHRAALLLQRMQKVAKQNAGGRTEGMLVRKRIGNAQHGGKRSQKIWRQARAEQVADALTNDVKAGKQGGKKQSGGKIGGGFLRKCGEKRLREFIAQQKQQIRQCKEKRKRKSQTA